MTEFLIDKRLEADSDFIMDLSLCSLRLMDDANYPWVLLVPRKKDLTEIIDLDADEQSQLMKEIAQVSKALKTVSACDKLNIGALGNQVSQLHIHIIARLQSDLAWPNPVWGAVPRKEYEGNQKDLLLSKLKTAITEIRTP